MALRSPSQIVAPTGDALSDTPELCGYSELSQVAPSGATALSPTALAVLASLSVAPRDCALSEPLVAPCCDHVASSCSGSLSVAPVVPAVCAELLQDDAPATPTATRSGQSSPQMVAAATWPTGAASRTVTFDPRGPVEHAVTPYATNYDRHPDTFDFDAAGRRGPPNWFMTGPLVQERLLLSRDTPHSSMLSTTHQEYIGRLAWSEQMLRHRQFETLQPDGYQGSEQQAQDMRSHLAGPEMAAEFRLSDPQVKITISIDNCSGSDLGLALVEEGEGRKFRIHRVRGNGSVYRWNQLNPGCTVENNDRIITVNDALDCYTMREEMKQPKQLNIVIVKNWQNTISSMPAPEQPPPLQKSISLPTSPTKGPDALCPLRRAVSISEELAMVSTSEQELLSAWEEVRDGSWT